MENDTFGGAILAWVKMKPSACDTWRDTRMGQDEALGMRHMPEKMQEARI